MTIFDSHNPLHQLGDPITAESSSKRAQHKRWLDVALASCGLLFLLPLLGIVAALVAIEHRSTPIFRQERRGQYGRTFRIWKFRTMSVLEEGGSVVAVQEGDTRVTRLGAFLRRTSIDELPQLVNVIIGDMSLVGPRPHALIHDDMLERTVEGYAGRRAMRPGITGLAQVSGYRGEMRDLRQMRARTELDLQYVSSWTLRGDARILWLTLFSSTASENAR